jgi:YesN/AraC family two-component response regulator
MFTSITDDEFLEIVMKVLSRHGIKHADIKKALEYKFKRSFSLISKRFMRCARETIFAAHDRVIVENAKAILRKKKCQEVVYDLGFRSESYFAVWFRKHTGTNPYVYKQFN